MDTMMTFFVGLLPNLVSFLNTLMLSSGVSVMAFLAALFLIALLINNLLLRGH